MSSCERDEVALQFTCKFDFSLLIPPFGISILKPFKATVSEGEAAWA